MFGIVVVKAAESISNLTSFKGQGLAGRGEGDTLRHEVGLVDVLKCNGQNHLTPG